MVREDISVLLQSFKEGLIEIMYYLIYISSATELMDETELMALLNSSRKNNKRNDITGMMLYKSGNFMQMLEGEKVVILSLFEKIKQDRRHKNIVEIFSGEELERCFQEWSMGFHNMDKEQDLPDFDRYIEASLNPERFHRYMNNAHHFMARFNERNR